MPCKKNSAAAADPRCFGLACLPSHADEDNTLMPKKQIELSFRVLAQSGRLPSRHHRCLSA